MSDDFFESGGVYSARPFPLSIAKEHFFHRESKELLDLIDQSARLGRTSRGQAFSDFLEITVATLSGGEMEEQYLAVVKRYAEVYPASFGSLRGRLKIGLFA